MTSAYTVFPNQGVRMKPFDVLNVKDRDGNLLEENRGEPSDVIRADTAFMMTNLLSGVLVRGTAIRAASLARTWPLAGKTGTVDDNTDAWFVGFDPDITVGVWIGNDDKRKSLGAAEQGSFAALPIWMEFMKAYIDGRPDKDHPPKFEAPGNIVFLPVDQANGAVLQPDAPGAIDRSVHLRHAARRPEQAAVIEFGGHKVPNAASCLLILIPRSTDFPVAPRRRRRRFGEPQGERRREEDHAERTQHGTAVTIGCSGGMASLIAHAAAAPGDRRRPQLRDVAGPAARSGRCAGSFRAGAAASPPSRRARPTPSAPRRPTSLGMPSHRGSGIANT